MIKAENGTLPGHQLVNQTSIVSPSNLYPAVESVFLKLRPKVHPPPSPPSNCPALLQSPTTKLPEDQDSRSSTDGEQQWTTTVKGQQWTITNGEQQWTATDGEQQWNTTDRKIVSSGEDDQHLVCTPRDQHTPFQVKPAAIHRGYHNHNYYCHCCGDQSLAYVLMDLY